MAFLASFITYSLITIFMIAVTIAGVFLGKNLRANATRRKQGVANEDRRG